MDEVVGRYRADLRRESGPAGVGELVRVDLRIEAPFPGGGEDPPGLLGGEGSLLDPDIAKACPRAGCNRGDHFIRDEVNVRVPAPLEFGRDRVGPEERGHEPNWVGV